MDGYKRITEHKINKLIKNFPVVAILGVRQCGKSTLAKMVGKDWRYFDLENPADFDLIENDPLLFLKSNNDKVIIDEAQIYPKLFTTLRGIVDEKSDQKGRFIITGSASFELIKNISESLAGRVGILELSTFSMSEYYQTSISDFFKIFEKKVSTDDLHALEKLCRTKSISQIKESLLKGGYPAPRINDDPQYFSLWMENYFKTYINQDMRKLFPNIDILKYSRVVRMLSSLNGTIINKSEVARSVETQEKSIRDYMQIIEGTYFWRELPAFQTSKIKTTISSPKGHYRDSGIALFLQNILTLEDLEHFPKLGNFFEAFVVEEILKGLSATMATQVKASHFRTKAGGEIDLILEGSFGLVPVEIKMQSNTKRNQLQSMINFIDLHNLPYGVVFNNCERPSLITEKIIQLPVGVL